MPFNDMQRRVRASPSNEFNREKNFSPNFFTFPTHLHLRLGTLKLKLLLHNILRQFFVRHAFCFKTTHLLLFKDLLQRCLKLGPLQYFREASLAKAQLDHLICLV